MVLCALFLGPWATPSVAQPYAEGWQFSDIGAPVVSGAATMTCQEEGSCQVSLSGAGVDISGTSDQFSFLHRQMTGDGVIIARVSSLVGADVWSRVGLMIRDSLAAESAHAMVVASSSRGLAFQRRRTAAAPSLSTAFAGQTPVWLKLERRQSSVIAYRSTNGTTWSRVGTDNITAGETVYVGLAITSRNPAATASAVLTDLQIPATVPDGWATADVGGVTGASGNANEYADGLFTVIASGADIGGSADQFRFTYRRLSGDVDIVSRVRSLEGSDAAAKAGVMIRTTLDAEAAHASVLVSNDMGIVFVRRPADGGPSVSDDGGSMIAPAWVKLERRGERLSAYSSMDGALWTFVGEETLTLPSEFYLGLAVTSHTMSESAKASFDNVSITSADISNSPPQVSLLASVIGTVTLGTAIEFTAMANDGDGTVAAVDFVVNDTVVETDSAAPFSAIWIPTAPGTYHAAAVARDNQGTAAASAWLSVTVLPMPFSARLAFTPSADHETGVDFYVATVALAIVPHISIATLDLGKPPVVDGEIWVDVASWVTSLPPGVFTISVAAVGPGGIGTSAPSTAFDR